MPLELLLRVLVLREPVERDVREDVLPVAAPPVANSSSKSPERMLSVHSLIEGVALGVTQTREDIASLLFAIVVPIVSESFIHDCIAAGHPIDHTKYILEAED